MPPIANTDFIPLVIITINLMIWFLLSVFLYTHSENHRSPSFLLLFGLPAMLTCGHLWMFIAVLNPTINIHQTNAAVFSLPWVRSLPYINAAALLLWAYPALLRMGAKRNED